MSVKLTKIAPTHKSQRLSNSYTKVNERLWSITCPEAEGGLYFIVSKLP